MKFRTIDTSDSRFEHEGLREVTFKSPALRARADVTLSSPATVPATTPIVILLHGVYGSHWAWSRKGAAHRTADRLIDLGAIPPMVLAMPSDGLWGDGSAYLAHNGKDFEAYIRDEIPALVRQLIPATTSGKLFIAGLSMGGFGALKIAAKNPAHFAAAAGHSSITHFSQMDRFVEEPLESFGPPPESEQSVLHWMQHNRAHIPPIRFDCGTTDPLIDHNRSLHRALVDQHIPHEYAEHPGGHEWPYWETHLQDTLGFFARVISQQQAE